MTIASFWSYWNSNLRNSQTSMLFKMINEISPDILTRETIMEELPILTAWMEKLNLEDMHKKELGESEREQLWMGCCDAGLLNREAFESRFKDYESLDKQLMNFGLAHETSFEEHAKVFLKHTRVIDSDVLAPGLGSKLDQCTKSVAGFIKYWVIAYISYT